MTTASLDAREEAKKLRFRFPMGSPAEASPARFQNASSALGGGASVNAFRNPAYPWVPVGRRLLLGDSEPPMRRARGAAAIGINRSWGGLDAGGILLRARDRTMRPRTGSLLAICFGVTSLSLTSCKKDEELKPEPDPCPVGLVGPALARIPLTDGMAFCVDEREVTWGEYKAFLAANPATGAQPAQCSWNTSFEAEYYDPDDGIPTEFKCDKKYSSPLSEQAVNCVDFCDAVAYCDWAGKHLCGRVGGPTKWGRYDQPFPQPTPEQSEQVQAIGQSTEMESQKVCTNDGATLYPYGNAYEQKRCIDKAWMTLGSGSLVVTDFKERECRGMAKPFADVGDLSGSVSEWNNLCLGDGCLVVGGSFLDDQPDAWACSAGIGFRSHQVKQPGVGFRCCAAPT